MGLIYRLVNLTYDDIEEIETWLFDCEIAESDIIEYIREELETEDIYLWDVNLKALVFEYILNKADVGELVSCVDINKEDFILCNRKEIEEAMSNVLVEDRNDAWLFLAEYFGVDTEIEYEK